MQVTFPGLEYATTEYAYVLNAIQEYTRIPQSRLRIGQSSSTITDAVYDGEHVHTVKVIPLNISVPNAINSEGRVDFVMSGFHGHSKGERSSLGLFECKLFDPNDTRPWEKKDGIRFWVWGSQRQHALSNLTIVEKSQYRKFNRRMAEIYKDTALNIEPPILPPNVLNNIYANTIGFLKSGTELKDKYEQYQLPFKRGVLFCGSPGSGKCIDTNTLVFSSEGIKPIGSFLTTEGVDEASDKEVYIHGIKGKEKTEQIYNGGYQKIKEISSRAGFSIKCTHNHKLMTTDGRTLVWKRSDELKPDDYIAIPRNMNMFGNKTSLEEYYFECYERIETTLPKEMNTDLAYFLGLLTGDGSLTIPKRFSFHTIELKDTYVQLLDKLFGITSAYIQEDKRSTSGLVSVTISSVRIRKFLDSLGMGHGACEKIVPQCVLDAPENIVTAFLQGLFDTDGWSDTKGSVGYASCSELLAKTVHLLLTNYGIICTLRQKKNDYSGSWTFEMHGDNAQKFYERIGFRLNRKQNNQNYLADKFNTNLDTIPYDPAYIKETFHECGIFKRDTHRSFAKYKNGKQKISHRRLSELMAALTQNGKNAEHLMGIGRDDIYWDKVKTIKDSHAHVADFYIPETHSFAAGGFINHNTLSCKWLRSLCIQNNFSCKVITMEQYEAAKQHSSIRSLFAPPRESPGLIFFDDMDVMVQDRSSGNSEIMNFLTNLDGIFPNEGVVYIFTTNYVKELDPAFVRNGRIDLFVPFRKPGKRLRKKFIEKKFQPDLIAQIDIDHLLEKSNDYSFAELEEVRKLLAFDLIAGKEISLDRSLSIFSENRNQFMDRQKLGFNKMGDDEEDQDNYDGLAYAFAPSKAFD